MDGPLSPPPRPLTFHARGGPSFGHSFSRPVSFEWAVRSGPCHCGQSNSPHKAFCAKVATVRQTMVRHKMLNAWILIAVMVFRIYERKTPSLAEYANLLAKRAKQDMVRVEFGLPGSIKFVLIGS